MNCINDDLSISVANIFCNDLELDYEKKKMKSLN